MMTTDVSGSGYYNYYHDKSRYETPDGKPKTAWYDSEIPMDEVGSNNVRPSRDYEGADVCRSVAGKLARVAKANRSKYGTADEVKDAIWAKYSAQGAYKNYTHEQRSAMARAEINMTLYGTVCYRDARIIGETCGDFTKSTVGRGDEEDRQYNINILGKQMANVLSQGGVNASILGSSRFGIGINGFSGALSVFLLDDRGNPNADSGLLEQMTAALSTGKNSRNLFHNLLVDARNQGLVPADQLAKYRLYSEFKQMTGEDIRDYKQTADGFVNNEGKKAIDIYKEHLKTSDKVPVEFKGAALDYYKEVEMSALKYDLAKVPEIALSMEYQDGIAILPGAAGGFSEMA